MGVTIQEYRCRIGIFLPKFSKTKCSNILSKNKNESSAQLSLKQLLLLILATLIPFTVAFLQYPSINHSNQSYNHPIYPTIQGIYTPAKNFSMNLVKSSIINQYSTFTELTNFYSRCTNGSRQARGIKIAHFNKGSGHLATKKHEIESDIAGFNPHIFGISEANLQKNHDLQDVKITDYNLHTCPNLSNPDLGYSRIVVYTHKSIVCKHRPDLMSGESSSIWMQVGLPRHKQFLVFQTYREWQLLNQADSSSKNIPAQLGRWVTFLDQWERALSSGLEVVVCGDMNINHLDWGLASNRQSGQTKKMKSLIEQLFQRILPHSVSQCVTVATRFMSGQPQTGLDHFYTNRPDKLSPVQAQFCGGSDHKLIFAIRYSKVINKNVRYVRKGLIKTLTRQHSWQR